MSATSGRRDSTRWDIQALRAFAVTAVVLYHLWPLRLPGGFVGVDVFFVISGYLITSHLVREMQGPTGIRLRSFWSRRVRRLLPASLLTLAVTGAAVLLVAPVTLWQQYARELVAATVYLQNWRLAADSVDYLAANNQPSPFQHFWSLSVEEQFYIALPLVLVASAFVARRAKLTPLTVVRVVLVAVIVLSFAWSLHQTTSASGIAYFSTATRAWEFAAGGLASTFAIAPAPRTTSGRISRQALALAGIAALLVSLLVITPTTPFPGTAALLPVAGAVLVVLFGGPTVVATLGRVAPVGFLGRISYSLYLWHWPLVALMPFVLRHAFTTTDKILILVASVAIASATTLFFEEPLRFSRRARALPNRRVALATLACSVIPLLVSAGTLVSLDSQQREAKVAAANLFTGDVSCVGAAALVGTATPCTNAALDTIRVPAPADVAGDDSNEPACWSRNTDAFNVCHLGPATGYTKRLLAVGDSHNNVFVGAYRAIADRFHWRIDVAGHSACYWTTAEQGAPSAAAAAACDGWKKNATAYIAAQTDLAAIIVTHSSTDGRVLPRPGVDQSAATVDGLVAAWKTATDRGIPIIAIRDNPHPIPTVVECVATLRGPTTGACNNTPAKGLHFDGQQEAVDRVGLGRVIDLTKYLCTRSTCPAVIGGVVVYRDPSHLTATFARTLEPYLGDALQGALRSLKR